MIRVFIVDDSAFMRKALERALFADAEIKIVGDAGSGEEALVKIPVANPDLVTLDVEMPGLNGIETLRGLLAWRPDLPVIMLSAHTTHGADATLEALALGAVDFIDKTSFSLMDLDGLGRELRDRIKVWRRDLATKPARAAPSAVPPGIAIDASHCTLCVIGASTGGPPALQHLLERLPAGFRMPITIVQHMPVGFTAAFAARLDKICAVRVAEAQEGDRLRPGTALIAPAGQHLRISSNLVARLSSDAAGARHVPSVDVMMHAAARAQPGKVLALLLTGMGDDGADGMCTIRAQGGVTIAESEESCVVFGMPRAAHLRGGVQHLLPLDTIAKWLPNA